MYKENGEGMGTSGSTVTDTPKHGEKTPSRPPRFTPGGEPGPGRPKAVTNKDYIAAIKASFPPDEITRLLQEAIAIAVKTNSWRGVVAALEFAANYSLGKPKQVVESSAGAGLAELLRSVDGTAPLLPAEGDGSDGSDVGTVDG